MIVRPPWQYFLKLQDYFSLAVPLHVQFQLFQNWSQLQKVSKTKYTTSMLVVSKNLHGQDKMPQV